SPPGSCSCAWPAPPESAPGPFSRRRKVEQCGSLHRHLHSQLRTLRVPSLTSCSGALHASDPMSSFSPPPPQYQSCSGNLLLFAVSLLAKCGQRDDPPPWVKRVRDPPFGRSDIGI